MAITIRQISISFPAILRTTDQDYYPEQEMVVVQVETGENNFIFPMALTPAMRNKVFQANNVEGEFIYDLVQAVKDHLNPPEE